MYKKGGIYRKMCQKGGHGPAVPPLNPPLHWRMKTIRVSLLRNTNELQDFISGLHSYPAALYIP